MNFKELKEFLLAMPDVQLSQRVLLSSWEGNVELDLAATYRGEPLFVPAMEDDDGEQSNGGESA